LVRWRILKSRRQQHDGNGGSHGHGRRSNVHAGRVSPVRVPTGGGESLAVWLGIAGGRCADVPTAAAEAVVGAAGGRGAAEAAAKRREPRSLAVRAGPAVAGRIFDGLKGNTGAKNRPSRGVGTLHIRIPICRVPTPRYSYVQFPPSPRAKL